MALSSLLIQALKSSLQICRTSIFSGAAAWRRCSRTPVYISSSSDMDSDNDNDNDIKPPQLKEEVQEVVGVGVAAETKKKTAKKTKEKNTTIKAVSANGDSKKRLTLTDMFRTHNEYQAKTETKISMDKQTEKAISDAILNFANSRIQPFSLSSNSDLVPSEPIDNNSVEVSGHLKEFPPDGCEDNPPEHQKAIVDERGDDISPHGNNQNVSDDLKEQFMKSENDQLAGVIIKPRSHSFTHQPFELSKEPCKEDTTQRDSGVNGFLNFLQFNDSSKGDHSRENLVNDTMQRVHRDDRFSSLDLPAVNSSKKDEKNKTCGTVSVPTSSNKDQKQLKNTVFAREEESEENKLTVRFLPSAVSEIDLQKWFGSCGKILKIEVDSGGGHLRKNAYLYFETRDALHKAHKNSGFFGNCVYIIVESAISSTVQMAWKTPVPCLCGDPDIPAVLVKNPTRTVKIERITREISSHHIEKALSFCESNITGYFLGSSHSVAYVEFETEIGKERALAKQSINVLGKDLLMLRIDSPRTTVVRISNIHDLPLTEVHSAYRGLGDTLGVMSRSRDILDVHFQTSEWPNMLKILNRLNGYEVQGRRLQAVPAPVFPPEQLLALWHQPEERKHLKAVADSLLLKLLEGPDMSRIVSVHNALFS